MPRSAKDDRVALVPIKLAASSDLTAEDARLVERMLEDVRRIARKALLDATVEIGDLLVEHLFGGDLELARSTRPDKPAAFRRLLERAPDYDLSPGLLKRAIALSVQYRELPRAVRDRLSTSQHLALLPVANPVEKSKLAARALREGLPSRALTRLVREQHPKAKTGRKPLTTLEKSVLAARRLLVSSVIESELSMAKLQRIPVARREALKQALHTLRERVERISDALGRVKG